MSKEIVYSEPEIKELTYEDVEQIDRLIELGQCRIDVNDWGTYWHTANGCYSCEITENWDGVIYVEPKYDWQGYLVKGDCQACGGDIVVGSGDQLCLDCGNGHSAP